MKGEYMYDTLKKPQKNMKHAAKKTDRIGLPDFYNG